MHLPHSSLDDTRTPAGALGERLRRRAGAGTARGDGSRHCLRYMYIGRAGVAPARARTTCQHLRPQQRNHQHREVHAPGTRLRVASAVQHQQLVRT